MVKSAISPGNSGDSLRLVLGVLLARVHAVQKQQYEKHPLCIILNLNQRIMLV
jgi:hypothetical protein